MSVVGLNDLLPISGRVRKIQTGSELLLAYELGKYAKKMMGLELSLTDVTIAKELLNGEHFSFVVTNGLDVGFVPKREDLIDYSDSAKYFFKNTVEGVAFKSETPEEVVYEFAHNIPANRILHNEDRSAAYVSLVAYLMVKSKFEGVPMPRLVIDHENYSQMELEYVDLFVLKKYGNKILQDLVEVKYSNAWEYQPEWEAFLIHHRQRGLMNTEYTMTEKFKHLRKNFEVGDVVLLYERTKGAKGKTINRLLRCRPAVIRYFDQTQIKLSYYPIVATKFTRRKELGDVAMDFASEGKESIYTTDDYERFITVNETSSLTEIGIGPCTFIEQKFIIKPLDDDGTTQYFRTENGMDMLWLSTLDTIYAVFEDQGVDYNRDKFLQTYFHSKNRVPVYEQYRQYQD